MKLRTLSLFVAFAAVASATADIGYQVVLRPDQPMAIRVAIPVRAAATEFQIPNWSPGAYMVGNGAAAISDLAISVDGKTVEATQPNPYTWTVPTKGARQVVVTYHVPVVISEEMGHYSGPRAYVYVVDRKDERCDLTIDVPAGWNIATGLDGDKGHFTAPTYDVLADNPVTFGKFRELRYVVDGRPHILALYGTARNDLDDKKIVDACRFISAAENDFFGNKPPYSHYVWHFNVGKRPDGGGGLEHLASTEITLANGLGPGIIGVCAHEFFHLWNVKRIRARVLGPFDYTKLPETGALWWLEGVTEFYAHQLMTRYGYWDDQKWYDTIVRDVQNVRRNPARLEVSPYEASFRVKDANNGRGNSNGYKISYYDLGVVAGLCLDLQILSQTNGRRSLDDVEHALWDMCKNNQPGFAEDEIRKQCIRFGGASMGDFYDRVIMKPGEMPVEDALAKVGLKFVTTSETIPDLGIAIRPSFRTQSLTVQRASGGAESAVKSGDVILAVNGKATASFADYNAAVAALKPGDSVGLKIKRGDETLDVNIVAGSSQRTSSEIQPDPAATPGQLKLREIWLYRGKKGWKPPTG